MPDFLNNTRISLLRKEISIVLLSVKDLINEDNASITLIGVKLLLTISLFFIFSLSFSLMSFIDSVVELNLISLIKSSFISLDFFLLTLFFSILINSKCFIFYKFLAFESSNLLFTVYKLVFS